MLQYVSTVCVLYINKKNIPFVQVKNKPRVRESKHAFILGSLVNMVKNNYIQLLKWFMIMLSSRINSQLQLHQMGYF